MHEAVPLPIEWLYFSAGLLTGALFCGIYFFNRERKMLKSLENYRRKTDETLAQKEATLHTLQTQNARLEVRAEELSRQLTRQERNEKAAEERFRSLAAKIMEENAERFSHTSSDRIDTLLAPLKEQIRAFHSRLENIHREETRELATLLAQIGDLKELNSLIGEEAKKLSTALRGEHKRQGAWGEMILERVLESSGLRHGREYVREVTLQDNRGNRYRPDAVIYLPGDRQVIIDAKTSLDAYYAYVNAEEDGERQRHAKIHAEAVRRHIDRLAQKPYRALKGVHNLDFVLMFMPIEGALALALQSDPNLFDYAFSKGIVPVSPGTLLVTLKAIDNAWRHERQNDNARLIAKKAGEMYDRFVTLAEEMEKLGRQLEAAQKSYTKIQKGFREGRDSLAHRAEEIRELGANTSKNLKKQPSAPL